jgi:Fic family protein
MAGKFELKTRFQFAGIIEKRDRWSATRREPSARQRWKELTGPDWARQNCALDEIRESDRWNSEVLDPDRARQLKCHMAAAQLLMRLSDEKSSLSPDDLLETHRLMLSTVDSTAGCFRRRDVKPLAEGHEPTEVELVPAVVENALEWFQSDSFAEMHEVEKTALMLIKLMDIQPFEAGNGKTLRLFSNFFLLESGYPPAIIPPYRASQYAIAMQNSLRFHTQPIIDLITESVDQVLSYLLNEPAAPPRLTVLQT